MIFANTREQKECEKYFTRPNKKNKRIGKQIEDCVDSVQSICTHAGPRCGKYNKLRAMNKNLCVHCLSV